MSRDQNNPQITVSIVTWNSANEIRALKIDERETRLALETKN